MLVAYIACRCAMYLTRPKSDDYTCRTVRKRLMDAGSNPASSTIRKNKGVSSVLGNLTNQPNKAFGLVLRYLRKERGLFQEVLALE